MSEPVRSATIYVRDEPVATLVRTRDGSELSYSAEAVTRRGPFVSFALPPREEPYVTQGDNLPAFFAGLLPEGVRLDALVRRAKTSRSDMFTLFMHVGDETIGDVTAFPEGGEARPVKPLRIGGRVRFSDLRSQLIDPEGQLSDSAIAGVMAKVSSARITTPIAGMGRKKRYLLKFENEDYPRLASNEHAVMELAARCGLVAAKTKVLTDERGEEALLVERFDRVWQPSGKFQKVHVEDACQFLALYPGDKYNVSLAEVVEGIAQFASSRVTTSAELIRRFCFMYLVGDSDYHAKNISLWVNPRSGVVELSPIYDCVSSLPYRGLNQRTALAMDGKDAEFRVKDFVRFGERFELAGDGVGDTVLEIADRAMSEIKDMHAGGVWPYDSEKVFNLVQERHRRLVS